MNRYLLIKFRCILQLYIERLLYRGKDSGLTGESVMKTDITGKRLQIDGQNVNARNGAYHDWNQDHNAGDV